MPDDVIKLLNPKVAEAASKVGLDKLTPVQEKAIPVILSGRHTLIVAPTGSGKTEAAMLPILSMMCDKRSQILPIAVIYVTPLRALNRDMFRRLNRLGSELGFEVDVRHSDTPTAARKRMNLSPPYILITTPETLSYVLINEYLRNYLRNVKWVVIDEFHELINSKRGVHLLVDLERLERIAGRYQRVALSASIDDKDLNEVKSVLAHNRSVSIVSMPASRESEIKVVVAQPDSSRNSESVNGVVDEVSDSSRNCKSVNGAVDEVLKLLKLAKFRNVIIFTNTRDEAEWLGYILMKCGLPVGVHHGSLSKKIREEVEKKLKDGSLKAVVATSSLELGIDIGHVDAIIQISSPRQAVKLLQKVGRSSHKLWLKAVGYIVANKNLDDILESLVIARRASNYNLEKLNMFRGSLDVLAHLLVGLGLEGGFIPDEALKILRKSYPYAELREEDLQEVVDLLVDLKYLIKRPDGAYVATKKGKIYYLTTNMIVESSQYDVIDAMTDDSIGELDDEFVAQLVSNRNIGIVLSGKVWEILGVDDKNKKIFVELGSDEKLLIPTWSGENIPVDFKVAREVCALRRMMLSGSDISSYLRFANNRDVLEYVKEVLIDHKNKGYALPTEREVLVEVSRSGDISIVIHCCLGSRGNLGLAHVVSYYLSMTLGVMPVVKSDPYRVYVYLPGNLNESYVETLLENLFSNLTGDVASYLRESLLSSTLAKHVARRVLVRFGIMPKDAPPQVTETLVDRYIDHEIISKEVLNEILTRYVDSKVLEGFFRGLKSGHLVMKVVKSKGLSPIAFEGLKSAGGYGRVSAEKLPKEVIVELIKRRLLEKEVKLYCLNCGNSWSDKIKNLPERVSCGKCDYSLVGVYFGSEDLSSLVRKVIKYGAKYDFLISEEEKKMYRRLADSANLVLDYGKKAVIALAARGVGPHNALKALKCSSEGEFYLTLHELERNYLRTRKYWDTGKRNWRGSWL